MQYSSRSVHVLLLPLLMAAVAAGASDTATVRTDLDQADAARVREVTRPATSFDAAERFEALSAGAATVREKLINRDIFSQPSANLAFEGRQRFQIGNGQDLTTVLGKILRIDPLDPSLTGGSADPVSANGKYRVPASNPFIGSSAAVHASATVPSSTASVRSEA